MESDYHWLVTVALVTSSIIAVTANSFLLLVFTRRRSLRTIPNRFVINLLVTNLLSSILLIPLLVVDQRSYTITQLGSFTTTSENNQTIQSIEKDVLIKEEIFGSNGTFKIIQTSEKILKTSSSASKLVSDMSGTSSSSSLSSNEDLLCYVAQASTSFVCTASIFSILLIGINQYFGVIHSLRYHFFINKFRASVFILSSWLIALTCAILSTATYSDGSLWHICAKRGIDESASIKALNTIYAFSYFFFVILAPFLAICIIYLCIYTAAHQNSERMRKSTSASTHAIQVEPMECSYNPGDRIRRNLPKVHSAPNFSSLESCRLSSIQEESKITRAKRTDSDSRSNFIINLKHKISNASVFRYREETRAAKISVIVIFMVLVCYLPYGLTLVLNSGCIKISLGQIFNYVSLVLLVFSNVISPFLFGYRNTRVKREIGRMLGWVPPPNPARHIDKRPPSIIRNRSYHEGMNTTVMEHSEPLLASGLIIPEVIVVPTKLENERKSILKRVGSGWNNYKKCNFISVPDCLAEARGSFSSASTQVSNDEF